MNDDSLIYVLALQHCAGIGDITAKRLIQQCGSAEAVFKDRPGHLLKLGGIRKNALDELKDLKHMAAAEKELQFIKKEHIDCHYYSDATYPQKLKHCMDAPILLFSSGAIKIKQQRVISIVGTRQMTMYGKVFCEKLIEDLAVLNPTIVSGFAYGVDICAQKAAIRHGLQTIGCLAHGLNQVYPKTHKRYVPQVEQNGGFYTDFWSTSKPERNNFLKRNRVIAGVSEATIVIESAERGGSLVTADIAQSYNREVFAVPGRTTDKYSVGCNNLIKQQKAHVLTSAADLIYILNWDIEQRPEPVVQKQLFVELDDTEKHIYKYLEENGKQLLDVIALNCDLPVHVLSSTLLGMEMKGVVRPLPGKLFEAV
ncbi:DNA-processing protein DprA [Zhouia spongiae]|uniref:DNA-processing protein DprA n=1 Tax=Zhouia spongiae TaxID=2202721 RepID=A0ABY3YPD3_9FLAO|nr:DNA-processing protein DprA [Zhouia spongiae]UNY99672.1 DNA-processing protein DprA [Zhouia spongiae]